ncbi:MAG: APC family permease, partial [Muribaculaceae bacterium]|nr:APC family permease [Muribaculaceae bacterium]
LIVVLAVYWIATFVTFKGQKYANKLSTFGGLTGTIIPAAILIVLGILYVALGHKIYIPTNQPFFPNFSKFGDIVLAASIFLFYAGMEMQAVHVPSMVNPAKNFPRACFIAVVMILAIFVFSTLAIGAAVPEKDINLLQSLLVAYNRLWAAMGVPWLGNVMALLITIGALAQVTVVISAPSTGILAVGRAGFLPRGLQKVNKNGIQVPILWVQGIFVTVLALALVIMPSVESAYQVLSQMSTVLYLIMVIIIYGAFLRLRRTEPNVKRGFRVPCGNFGKWFVFILGVLGALVALVISFVPPAQISTGSPVVYVGIILIGVVVFVAFPFIVYAKRKPSWRDPDNDFYPFNWQIEGRKPDQVSKWAANYQPTEAEIQAAMKEGIAEGDVRTNNDVSRLS